MSATGEPADVTATGMDATERDATEAAAFDPDAVDLEALDRRFREALRTGSLDGLPVVGYGEVSIAFGWPPDRPTVVAKSLPPFEDARRLEAYADVLDEYLDALTARGVEPVPTAVRSVADGGRRRRAYVLQPSLPAETIGPAVLARADAEEGEALLTSIVDTVLHATDEKVGIDGQVSNWAVSEGRLRFLDVSTPMLRGEDGHDLLDHGVLLGAYPWITRWPLGPVVISRVFADYHDPWRVVRDLAGNLIRERLTTWIPVLLGVANPHFDRPLTVEGVRDFYRWNARFYTAVQALRRADRAWQRHVRRREYPLILPPSYRR
jgi:hypothetical protein